MRPSPRPFAFMFVPAQRRLGFVVFCFCVFSLFDSPTVSHRLVRLSLSLCADPGSPAHGQHPHFAVAYIWADGSRCRAAGGADPPTQPPKAIWGGHAHWAPFGDILKAYANGAPSGDMLGIPNSCANATGAPSWASTIGMPSSTRPVHQPVHHSPLPVPRRAADTHRCSRGVAAHSGIEVGHTQVGPPGPVPLSVLTLPRTRPQSRLLRHMGPTPALRRYCVGSQPTLLSYKDDARGEASNIIPWVGVLK